jgi:membrane associated rhomboid family serine protease
MEAFMLPTQDLNPTRRTPILTYLLIAINVIVFIWEMSLGERQLQAAFMDLAVVPSKFSPAPFSPESLLDVLRSMFFHGSIEHIFGNMLYLWLFGDNVEDRFGKILYLVLYFVSGYVAAFTQTLIDPNSTVPMVGASGAIAGVLGSYLILFPNVRVRGIIPLGRVASMQELPAWAVLGFWFVLQLFNGITSLGPEFQGGGVAFFAHIGGFIAGVVLTFIFSAIMPQPPLEQRNQMLYDRASRYRY